MDSSIKIPAGFYGFVDPEDHLQLGFPLRQGNVPVLIQKNVHGRGQLDQLN